MLKPVTKKEKKRKLPKCLPFVHLDAKQETGDMYQKIPIIKTKRSSLSVYCGHVIVNRMI